MITWKACKLFSHPTTEPTNLVRASLPLSVRLFSNASLSLFFYLDLVAENLKGLPKGVIWTAICVDYPGHSFSHIGLYFGQYFHFPPSMLDFI